MQIVQPFVFRDRNAFFDLNKVDLHHSKKEEGKERAGGGRGRGRETDTALQPSRGNHLTRGSSHALTAGRGQEFAVLYSLISSLKPEGCNIKRGRCGSRATHGAKNGMNKHSENIKENK